MANFLWIISIMVNMIGIGAQLLLLGHLLQVVIIILSMVVIPWVLEEDFMAATEQVKEDLL